MTHDGWRGAACSGDACGIVNILHGILRVTALFAALVLQITPSQNHTATEPATYAVARMAAAGAKVERSQNPWVGPQLSIPSTLQRFRAP